MRQTDEIRCMIVDDEPLAQDVLKDYINDTPGLSLESVCKDALEAMQQLEEKVIDLIFLDINMPKLSGISFLRSQKDPPLVILTTAYPEYAVEGFELDVVDYLLKPFGFDRFMMAINKVKLKMKNENGMIGGPRLDLSANRGLELSTDQFLAIKVDKRLYKINLSDIFFFNSYGDYVKVITKEGTKITNESLKNIEAKVPPEQFLRIHKSYLINLNYMKYVEGNEVMIEGEKIPIGAKYKDSLKGYLNLDS